LLVLLCCSENNKSLYELISGLRLNPDDQFNHEY
jgi:hypothetical protein